MQQAAAASPVTHVLCCPRCPFMSLQSQVLASHAFHSHSLEAVPVFRCRLCLAASTQSDIMREHASVYHGCDSHLMTKELIRSPEAAPTGSRKRKSTVPERIPSEDPDKDLAFPDLQPPEQKRFQLLEQTPTKSIVLPLGLTCGVLGVISNNYTFGCQTETALDLSLKTKRQPVALQQQQQPPHLPPPPPPQSKEQQQQQLQQQQQQRQNFSSSQNSQLLHWFAEHRGRPYPGAEDTKALALATGLSYSQVKKWFANKRMRSKMSSASPEPPDESSMMEAGGSSRSLGVDGALAAKYESSSCVAHGNESLSRASSEDPDRANDLSITVELQ